MLEFETKGNGTYLFGMEESYGCLPGTYCRDKDAVVASMALCEAAAYYKTQGKTLWDAMLDLYEKYGYYKDDVKAITLKGIEGLAKIQEIMTTLRDNTPAQIGEYKVLKARDYKKDTVTDLATGAVTPTRSAEFQCSVLRTSGCSMGMLPSVRYRAKTEILLWCESRYHGSSRCQSSRAWCCCYGNC